MPVRSSPSIEMSMNAGMQTRSRPPGATYPREMAIALTAWLIAPAPMAWTSTRPLLRITPAIAPATATGLAGAETLSTYTGARSTVIAGTPSNVFTVDSLDRCSSACRTINVNQYRIECHGSGRHRETARDTREEPLHHDVFVHSDAAVTRPDHPHIRHIGRSARQDPRVGRGHVGVRAYHRTRPAVQVPAHRVLLGRRLSVHTAQGDARLRTRAEDRVSGAKGVVERVQEDPPDQVHDQHLTTPCFDQAPPLAGGGRRVVRGPQDALEVRQLSDKLFLGEDVVSARDDVRAGGFQLGGDLGGQAEPAGGVLAVDDRQVRAELLLQGRKDRLDGIPARMADDISHEQNLEVGVRHSSILGHKKKGARRRTPFHSFRVLDRPGLPHHGDADLTGEAELRLDALGDVARHQLSGRVVDLFGFDQDPDLAAGLDRVRLLDALEGVGDLLQLLEPLDVGLQRLPARPGTCSGDRVGGDQQQRLDGVRLFVVVVRSYRVHNLSRHRMSLKKVCPDHGVRALDFVVDGLADVVQQTRELGDANVGADLGRHHGGEVGDLFGVVQHLLSVARSEAKDAEMADDLGMQTLEPELQYRRLPLLFDPLQDLLAGLGDDLFDPGRMNPAIDDELVERDPRDLATDRIEPADDHGLGGVVDDQVDPRGLLKSADVPALLADDAALQLVGR